MYKSLERIKSTNPYFGGIVDFFIYSFLVAVGFHWTNAHVIAYVISSLFYFFASPSIRGLFVDSGLIRIIRIGAFVGFFFVTLALRAALIDCLLSLLSLHPILCFVPALIIGLFAGEVFYRFINLLTQGSFPIDSLIVYAACLVFFLKPFFIGSLELIPEEAYYWLYAKHLSPGYLDHPPLVGWLIKIGTTFFGTNEFGVRIGAVLAGLITAFIVYGFSRKLFDKGTSITAGALSLLLPYFWGASFLVSPDAGLMLFWALSLWMIWNALEGARRSNWILVGLTVGLGMLSKYSIALLALPVLTLIWIVPSWRKWLKDPYFYSAPIVALFVFSPVLFWNATHSWASFAFQSSRRLQSTVHFSLHSFLLDVVCLITPTAFAITAVLISKNLKKVKELLQRKEELFCTVCFVIPFSVFALYSLRHVPKLNWSGPSFLALLPLIGRFGIFATNSEAPNSMRFIYRSWVAVIVIWVSILGVALHYLGYGFPFIPYSGRMHRVIGWRSLADAALEVSSRLEVETGKKPILVGMDKHNIASELWFYAVKKRGVEAPQVGSRNIIGEEALMFRYWSPPETFVGNTMILVAREAHDIADQRIRASFASIGPLEQFDLKTGWSHTKGYYYRIGYGYKGVSSVPVEQGNVPELPNQAPPVVNQS